MYHHLGHEPFTPPSIVVRFGSIYWVIEVVSLIAHDLSPPSSSATQVSY